MEFSIFSLEPDRTCSLYEFFMTWHMIKHFFFLWSTKIAYDTLITMDRFRMPYQNFYICCYVRTVVTLIYDIQFIVVWFFCPISHVVVALIIFVVFKLLLSIIFLLVCVWKIKVVAGRRRTAQESMPLVNVISHWD